MSSSNDSVCTTAVRRFGVSVIVAATIAMATGIPISASSEPVMIVRASAVPSTISPANEDGVQDAAVVEIVAAVQERGGLGSFHHRAHRADEKRFVVRWLMTMVDVAGGVAARTAWEQTLAAPESTAWNPAGERLVHGVGVWSGTSGTESWVADGEYEVHVAADVVRIDVLGNGRTKEWWLGGAEAVAGVVVVDNTPPAVTIEVPGCSRGPVVPRVEVRDSHPGAVMAALDGAAHDVGLPVDAEGDHVLRITATDRAGNTAVAEASFTIDRTLPRIAVTGVEPGAALAPEAAIEVEVEEPHLVSSEIRLDGSPYDPGTPILEVGDHTLTVEAVDCAGNRAFESISFSVVLVVGSSTVLFGNLDDPGLFHKPMADGRVLEAFGTRDGAGMPASITSALLSSASGETWVGFGEDGRLDHVASSDGNRLVVTWISDSEVQLTLSSAGGVLASTELFPIPGSDLSPATAVGRTSARRMPEFEFRATRRGEGSSDRRVRDVPAGSDLAGLSITALQSRTRSVSAAVGPLALTACESTVEVSTCGVPTADAEVVLRVVPDDPDVPEYSVPAFRIADGLFRYAVPCAVGAVQSVPDYCAASDAETSRACASVDRLSTLPADAVCETLASRVAFVNSPPQADAVRWIEDGCRRLLSDTAGACEAMRQACAPDADSELVDRRYDGDLDITMEVADASFGALTLNHGVSGAGPFPPVSATVEDGDRVTGLDADWMGDLTYNVIGRVACAPEKTMVYDAELCDLDGTAPGCYPFVWTEPTEADGTGEIGFGLTGRYGADVIRVTFGTDGGPSRQVVVGY